MLELDKIVLLHRILKKNIMATITLEYNARSSTASRIIDVIIAMDRVFKVKTPVRTSSILTRKAIEDVENGNVVTCESYEDYLKQTAEYA
jgi:hypothetical protein